MDYKHALTNLKQQPIESRLSSSTEKHLLEPLSIFSSIQLDISVEVEE